MNRDELLAVLNKDSLREHLIKHEYFDDQSLNEWIKFKLEVDSLTGCRVRLIYIGGVLAGWCGLQPDDSGFEMAVVISQQFWGSGLSVFKTMIGWAKELGHKEIVCHLLDSRPEYRALKRISKTVHKAELLGRCFTTYCIELDKYVQSKL
ncbi:N-acetyltransferase [Microbulbifer sp. SSSA008]|uniref:N-acetyltransferase n=1 Tax=Microbulbifer sp. SSSA008 TaxID=3243380 RepID=UPI004039CDED